MRICAFLSPESRACEGAALFHSGKVTFSKWKGLHRSGILCRKLNSLIFFS